jgi:uncharacterized protein (TIGR01244 family)
MNRAVLPYACAAILIGWALADCSPKESEAAGPAAAPAPEAAGATEVLEEYACGTVERLHTWNGIFAGSQPAAQDLHLARENGIQTVVNLRPASEDPGFDEAALVEGLGMEYRSIPFASPEELTDAAFEEARAVLRDESRRPLFLHCNSGNRVGAIWYAFRALDGGLTSEEALAEAKRVGLKSPAFEQRAREYVERTRG